MFGGRVRGLLASARAFLVQAWVPSEARLGRYHWLTRYGIVAVFALGLLQLYERLHTVNRGWDFETYQTAVEVLLDGKNPYDPAVLRSYGHAYLYVYPPILLPFLFLFTFPTRGARDVYLLEYALLVVASATLLNATVPRDTSVEVRLWAFPVLMFAFAGGYWSFWTGNADVIVLAALSIGIYLAHSGRGLASGVALGFAGAIKFIPLAAAGGWVLSRRPIRQKLGAVAGTASGFAAVFGGSLLVYPDLFPGAYLAAVRREGGFYGFLGEGSVVSTPSHYLWQDLLALVGIPGGYGLAVHGAFVVAVAAGVVFWIRSVDGVALQLSLAVMGALLVWPRMRPYYLLYAAPAVLLVTAHLEEEMGAVNLLPDLLLALVVPMARELAYLRLGREGVGALPPAPYVLVVWGSMLGLMAWFAYRFPRREAARTLRRIRGTVSTWSPG